MLYSFLHKKTIALPKCQLTIVWKNERYALVDEHKPQCQSQRTEGKERTEGREAVFVRPQDEHVVFETTFHFHSAMYAQLERRQKKFGKVGDACLNELKLSFTYRDKIIQFISVTFTSVRCMCTLPQPLAETGLYVREYP